MSEKPEPKAEKRDAGPALMLGREELAAIVAAAVSAAAKESESATERIVEALLESRKPYKDPATEVNDEKFRETQRELLHREFEGRRAEQRACCHKMGSRGSRRSEYSSFMIHESDTGLMIGVCTGCQKMIFADRPEDQQYFQNSGNTVSRAGHRNFLDPKKARDRGRPTGYDEPQPAVAEPAVTQ